MEAIKGAVEVCAVLGVAVVFTALSVILGTYTAIIVRKIIRKHW